MNIFASKDALQDYKNLLTEAYTYQQLVTGEDPELDIKNAMVSQLYSNWAEQLADQNGLSVYEKTAVLLEWLSEL